MDGTSKKLGLKVAHLNLQGLHQSLFFLEKSIFISIEKKKKMAKNMEWLQINHYIKTAISEISPAK